MREIVIETDSVCSNTKLLLCFASAALLIAGMSTLLVGIVLKNIKAANTTVCVLTLKQNNAVVAEIHKT